MPAHPRALGVKVGATGFEASLDCPSACAWHESPRVGRCPEHWRPSRGVLGVNLSPATHRLETLARPPRPPYRAPRLDKPLPLCYYHLRLAAAFKEASPVWALLTGMMITLVGQGTDPDRVLPVYPAWVLEGLRVEPAGGMRVRVGPGRADVGGRQVAVAAHEFAVSPPPIVRVENEKLVLSEEKPAGWAHGTSLKQCTCFGNGQGAPLPGCLRPGSVRVKQAPTADALVYVEGKDYLLDSTWAKLGRVAGGSISQGQEVYVDYEYRLARLDTLAVREDGAVLLIPGEAKPTCPEPPAIPAHARPLANLLVWYDTQEITAGLIFPCGPPFPEPDEAERARRQALVSRTLAKLKAGDTVTIVAWGDSVTVGGDAQPMHEKAFPYAFAARLQSKYPTAKIRLINAGIGGSNTQSRLPNLEQDVLAHRPDLVTIEFVNDCWLPGEVMEANWREAISRIKAIGAEIIVITPHWTMPPWMGMSYADLWGRDKRENVARMRALAREMNVALADVSLRWEHLAQEGLPYVTLLWNGINHPDNRGHDLFVRELMTFF
jgi:lysophospholipase L1-like esterase